MAVIGTSQTQRDLLESSSKIFEDIIELEKGQNVHRVIQGPQKTLTLFYPTIIEINEGGEKQIKATFKAVNFLDVPPIINSMITAEQTARRTIDNKEELGLKIQTRWWYLAINTMDKVNIKVKPVRYPKSIKDDITKIETRLDVKDNEYLLDGHYFLYDLLIEKVIDPSKQKRYGTSYNAFVYGNNPWKQRIPSSWMKADSSQIIESLGGMKTVFPEEYIDAIESCDIILEKVLTPMTEFQVNDALQKFPINLLGRRSTEGGGLTFPQTPEFEEMLKSLNIPVVHYDADAKKTITQGQSGIKLKKPEEVQTQVELKKPIEEVKTSGLKFKTIDKQPIKVEEQVKQPEISAEVVKPKLTLSGLKK